MSPNLKAFLDMIAFSEGTDNGRQATKNHGYDVIVGGGNFTDYSDHPNQLVWIKQGLASTAAGRYQILNRYWKFYKNQLKLSDFSPASQDAVAIQQIKECKALEDIEMGYIDIAIGKCSRIWASLPGAGYGQHENDSATLIAQYQKNGGTLA